MLLIRACSPSAAMEEIRSSRRHAKSTYRDVFGGAPNYTSTYVSKSDEYHEIFGGITTASSSIPFLDLPDSNGDDGNVGFIDYGEIFGGFDAGKFAVDYQEMLKGSANERTQTNAKVHEPVDMSSRSTNKEMNDRVESLDNSKSSSSFNSSDHETRQFNMSYHRTTRGSIDDVLTGKTCVTEFHAMPEYTYSVDSCSSFQDARSKNSSTMQVKDHVHRTTYNEPYNDMNQLNDAHPSDAIHDKKRNAVKVKMCKEEFSSKLSSSEDTSVHIKSHSCSSSNNSESSVNVPYRDAGFVNISNINLRTQPSKLPPPSREPPKIAMRQESTMLKEPKFSRGDQGGDIFMLPTRAPKINYSIGSSKSQEFSKNSTSSFHDVEMDASSALAASAAAMKEVMEQAQARLKSAKELMEKKRDKPQILKKLSCKETTILDKTKASKGFEGDRVYSGISSSMKSSPIENEKYDYMLDDSQTGIKVSKAAPMYCEKESFKDDGRHMSQDDEFPDVSNLGEWRTEKQFCDLVDNIKSSETSLNTMINNNDVKCTEKSPPAYEFNGASKLANADTIKLDELNITSESVDAIHEVEIIQQQDKISELTNGDEEFLEAQDVLTSEPELTNSEDPCEYNEQEVDSTNDDPKLEEIYLDEKTIELHAVEEAWECSDNEKVLSPTFVSCESENSLKMSETDGQLENVVDSRKEEVEELKTYGEACLQEKSVCTIEIGRANSFHEEDECKSECSSLGNEHEKCRKTDAQETCTPDEKNKVTQCDKEQEESSEKVDDPIITEEELNSTLESEVQFEQKLEGTHSVVENTMEPETLKFDYSESKNKEIKASREAHSSEDKDSAPDGDESKDAVEPETPKFDYFESKNEETKAASKVHSSEDKDSSPNGDESKDKVDDQAKACAENEDLVNATKNINEKPHSFCRGSDKNIDPAITEKFSFDVNENEHLESEKAKAKELEMARKAEEEKKREREREKVKERLANERRVAQERAERLAVERATAEARQRALAEAKEKAEKAAAEALERSIAEKALKEAKLRAERAAVERATAEARERAVEKALADKAAADARLRASRINNSDVVKDVGIQNGSFSGSFHKREDSSVPGDVESPLRCKAKLERHQRTVERAAKALAEKNKRDILAQREQAERNRISESLDAEVRRWSTGKEGNLRALLSTLQYILGPDSGWQPIPLTDVITAVAVKKAYRKATLYVHPDKLQQRGASIHQKYICEKVFDLLKEAWNRFNSEER